MILPSVPGYCVQCGRYIHILFASNLVEVKEEGMWVTLGKDGVLTPAPKSQEIWCDECRMEELL